MSNFEKLNERLSKNKAGQVYEMNEIDLVLNGLSPMEVLMRVNSSNFNTNHDYFEFDGYGNLNSFETLNEALDLYEDIK